MDNNNEKKDCTMVEFNRLYRDLYKEGRTRKEGAEIMGISKPAFVQRERYLRSKFKKAGKDLPQLRASSRGKTTTR